jgi:hypothetical protein
MRGIILIMDGRVLIYSWQEKNERKIIFIHNLTFNILQKYMYVGSTFDIKEKIRKIDLLGLF